MDEGQNSSAPSVAKSKFVWSTENGSWYRSNGVLLVVEEEPWRVILFYLRKVRNGRRAAQFKLLKKCFGTTLPQRFYRPRCEDGIGRSVLGSSVLESFLACLAPPIF